MKIALPIGRAIILHYRVINREENRITSIQIGQIYFTMIL